MTLFELGVPRAQFFVLDAPLVDSTRVFVEFTREFLHACAQNVAFLTIIVHLRLGGARAGRRLGEIGLALAHEHAEIGQDFLGSGGAQIVLSLL